jgi:hypothetical protein
MTAVLSLRLPLVVYLVPFSFLMTLMMLPAGLKNLMQHCFCSALVS